MSLIVTGSIGIDSIQGPSGTANNVLGGSCIYFAAAASFFSPVRLVGAVGEDFPPDFVDVFKHFKLDLTGLEMRKGSKTFRWSGKYHTDMNIRDTIGVELNVLAEKLPPVPTHYRDSHFVFLANTHPAGQLELLSQFPTRKIAVADTMDIWITHEKPTLLKLLSQIDGLVLNDSEAKMLTGQNNLIIAAEEVLKLGPKFVVIKKGEHGCLLRHKDGVVVLPAFPANKVVDPTGAGDSFAGGMMGYLSQSGSFAFADMRKALAYGTVVASYNIEAFSLGRLQSLTRKEIDQRCKEYCAMLQIA